MPQSIVQQLREQGVRVSADISAQRMNAKIREAQLMKVPYMLVVGENEADAGQVSLRVRDGSRQNNIPLAEFIDRAKDRISRRARRTLSNPATNQKRRADMPSAFFCSSIRLPQ